MTSVGTLLLVWMEIVMTIKAVLSISAMHLIAIWTTDVVKGAMMRPD